LRSDPLQITFDLTRPAYRTMIWCDANAINLTCQTQLKVVEPFSTVTESLTHFIISHQLHLKVVDGKHHLWRCHGYCFPLSSLLSLSSLSFDSFSFPPSKRLHDIQWKRICESAAHFQSLFWSHNRTLSVLQTQITVTVQSSTEKTRAYCVPENAPCFLAPNMSNRIGLQNSFTDGKSVKVSKNAYIIIVCYDKTVASTHSHTITKKYKNTQHWRTFKSC